MTPLLLVGAALAGSPDVPARHQLGPCIHHSARRAARPSTIGSVASDLYPIRVHWDQEGYDDEAEVMLGHLETAWAVQIEELGFRPPYLPDAVGPDALDIYLGDTGDVWSAWAEIDKYEDQDDSDNYMSASSFIVMHRDMDPDWAAGYLAHEFNHTLQWGTDFTEDTLPIWEAVATACEKWTTGDDKQWASEMSSFQEAPFGPMLVGDSYGLYDKYGVGYTYEYGAALWVIHIDEVIRNGDHTTGALLWEATANGDLSLEPDVVDAVLEVTDMELGEFMNSVALSRWLVGSDWDERGLADAENWKPGRKVPAEQFTGDDLPIEGGFTPGPMVTGQAFTKLDVSMLETGVVEVAVRSESGLDSATAVFWWGADGSVGELGDWGANPTEAIEVSDIDTLVVVVSNLGLPGWDGDEKPYYREGDQVLSVSWDPDGSEPDHAEGEEPAKSCGCSTNGSAGWLAVPLLALFVRRRVEP